MRTISRRLVKKGLLTNSSQMIGPKTLNFSGIDGDHPEVDIRKFSEERRRTLPVDLLFQKFSGCRHNSYA